MLLVTPLVSLFLLWAVRAIDPPRQPHQPRGNGTKLLNWGVSIEDSSSVTPSMRSVSWADTERDGEFLSFSGGDLVFESLVTGEQRVFVSSDQVPEDVYDFWIKPDLTKVLWATNFTQQYRHSYWANYEILDVESGEVVPLVEDQHTDIQYAAWSPVGDVIAFVRDNDMYLWKSGEITRVTYDGSENKFNGVPDWVYEEEILGDRFSLWFSPDGEFIAYLSFDETGVPTFTVDYYMDNQEIAPKYPYEWDIRYPKVGETNPTVEFNIVNVETLENTTAPIEAFPEDELIIGEVAWVTDDHSHVIYRTFNRVQDLSKHVVVDVEAGSASIVRERDGTDGWIDNMLMMTYVGALGSNGTYANSSTTYYLDVSDESGWRHLYLYPVTGGSPIALTEGEWEILSILKIDQTRGLVYYTSTEAHSTESHLYSVSFETGAKKALVDDSVPAYWTASFSNGGGYYILSYYGPDVPYQELYAINSTTPLQVITSNEDVYNEIQTYNLPKISYFEITNPDGYTLNVMERLPATFDSSKKYPVLFYPYGGPGAQMVDKRFEALTWSAYLASDPDLEFILYVIDNRGMENQGRAFRTAVASRLGSIEVDDQIYCAQELLAQNAWMDASHMAFMGKSYGGYLTAKVIEADTGVFTYGMIVSPVSDWRFYDSMYTERYMKLLSTNADGYNASAVRDPAGFHSAAGGVLVQHGTGDDNVHFQHSAVLVDLLVGAGVSPEKLQVQWFTDSDHSLTYNGASLFAVRQLTMKLWEEKNREEGELGAHAWSRRDLEVRKREFARRIGLIEEEAVE
ncbi:dipeptidyl peptidase IV N-terminal region-domain-containing protein [Lineolata rhizophorae]|uniref:dipeptidyl-peptidase IV n=1 Tax=Lineolata rhizophorae TaxID=578093 RepID=A0A6A6NX39_9PEZI|nr:dipeptidyl peptidase IV N-terminal region-domain-containing protein [Lineolata rhizophorae]